MQEVSRRHRQVANAIKEEIVAILRKDISDPRLEAAGMITVSGLDLSQDMKNATVWVSFMGKEENDPLVEGALGALKKSNQYIHRLLIKRIPMKMHPKLVFRFDKIFDRAAKLSEAFQEASELEEETKEFRKKTETGSSEKE